VTSGSGAVLLERGYVSDESLQQAIGRHGEVGGRLADVLVHIGVISEQRIARAVEESIGIPLVMLPRVDVMPEALAKLSSDTAYELGALPFALDGNRLRVAFEDPLDALAIEEIEDASGCIVEPYQALHKELQWAIATYYPELGLEPPADFHVDTSQRLGALAVERGLMTEEQLHEAVAEQQRTGGLLGRIFVKRGLIDDDALAALLAEQMGLPFATPSRTCPSTTRSRPPAAPRRRAVQRRAVRATATRWSWRSPTRGGWATSRRSSRAPSRSSPRPRRQVQQRIDAMYADDKGRLGETLLMNKKLKREQLRKALARSRPSSARSSRSARS
jgi:type IV pilus assembly protein PilB